MPYPRIDYPSLAAVAAVVKEGSFERAATSLGITASAVSQRVKAAEERIGATLVVRSAPCGPTAIGARLCAHFENVRLLEESIVSGMPALLKHHAGTPTIRVAVNGDSLSTWFPAAVKAFVAQCGALLDLVLEGEDQGADRLRSGDVLAAVTVERAPVHGCRTVSLGMLRYVAVATPSFFTRYFAQGVDVEVLARTPMLRIDRNDTLQARWMTAAFGTTLSPPTHWMPSSQGFIDCLRAGAGWGVVPELLAAPHLATSELRPLIAARSLDIALYWQYSRLFSHVLDDLNQAVVAAARAALPGDVAP